MPSNRPFWSTHPFDNSREIRLELDQLVLRILKRGNDLLVAERRGDTGPETIDPEAEPESDFRRYAFEYPVDGVEVTPRTPDRPLVVQPVHPLRLAPQAQVDFYVSCPVDLQLSTVTGNKTEPMERIRSEVLSDTWFGDTLAGVLCYSLKSPARRELKEGGDADPTGRAICKLQIHNESLEQLHCRKFCLRLDHCHLWLQGATLWTSPVRVRFHGRDQMSAVDYSSEPPHEAKGAEKLATASEEPLSGLIRRTFAFAGIGQSTL
ncbi:MAG: DUF432 domain-containing protein [Verrucomicrobiota bacterium]